MSAQEVVATTFADAGVTVAWDAQTPWADVENKVVHLRPVPDQLSDEIVEDIRSDCDHELGHIKFTNPAALAFTGHQLIRAIANSIEDGRVERLMAAEWVGCGENLEHSADRAIKKIVAAKENNDPNRRARVLCALSLIAFGRPVEAVLGQLGDDLRPMLEPVVETITKIARCRSTEESVAIASELAGHWQWQPSTQEQKRPAGGDSQPKSAEERVVEEIGCYALSPADERKRSIGKLELTANNSYRAKTDNDRVEPIKRPSFDVNKLFAHFFDGIRKIVPTLRRQLIMEFRSAGKKGARHLLNGKLDERSLFRVALGDPRVYKADRQALVHKSTVTLLVDCSASMTHVARPESQPGEPTVFRTKLFVAAQAAAAVSHVLDLLRVPNEVLAFTTVRTPVPSDPHYQRVRPIRHLTIKPFNKRAHACRANFVSLGLFEHCSENIDGEAVLWAAQRLISKSRTSGAPVMIVFSDGEPASQPEDHDVLARHLHDAITKVEKAGVSVFGVGIASDAVKKYYRNSVIVSDVSNLVAEFYELLRKVLRARVSFRV